MHQRKLVDANALRDVALILKSKDDRVVSVSPRRVMPVARKSPDQTNKRFLSCEGGIR